MPTNASFQEQTIASFQDQIASTKPKSIAKLRPNTTFKGYQRTGKFEYDMTATIQTVDLDQSYACGYLVTKGMTTVNPVIKSFFEVEIIGREYSFETKKWDTTFESDREHWNRLPGFKNEYLNGEYDILKDSHIFMRWNERFLVPNHKQVLLNATLDGFYYLSMSKQTGEIAGFHYLKTASEWFQPVLLKYQFPKSFSSFEFR